MTRARGFTLLEVLLATVLFGFLMSGYYVVFLNVVELEEYARAQRAFSTLGPAILDLVEDDLLSLHVSPTKADAFPFRGSEESLQGQPADRMNFVARRLSVHQEDIGSRGIFLRSPLNEVGYRLGRGEGEVRRLYRREGYSVDAAPLEGGDYHELYDRVVSLDIHYAGYRVEEAERSSASTLGQHELERFESWDSEERKGFPAAVIVTLVLEPPLLGVRPPPGAREAPPRQTFVRIIPLVQAHDVPPAPAGPAPAAGN